MADSDSNEHWSRRTNSSAASAAHALDDEAKRPGRSSFAVMVGFFVLVCLLALVFFRLGAPIIAPMTR